MLVFDFFSGTGSSTQAFADAGHTVISFELDTYFEATHHVDMFEVTSEWLRKTYGLLTSYGHHHHVPPLVLPQWVITGQAAKVPVFPRPKRLCVAKNL
jgi:hypothetical protein